GMSRLRLRRTRSLWALRAPVPPRRRARRQVNGTLPNADFPRGFGRARITDVSTRLERDSAESLGRVDELVGGVFLAVDTEMRGQPAPMVYEILEATLQRRLPGIDVDEESVRDAAARISVGMLLN